MARGRPRKPKQKPALSTPLPGNPKCNRKLSKSRQKIWNEIIRVMGPSRLLTQADAVIVELLVIAYETVAEADAKIVKTGGAVLTSHEGGLYQNPWLAIRNRAAEDARKLCEKIGLDPASRQRLNVVAEESSLPDPKDRFFADHGG